MTPEIIGSDFLKQKYDIPERPEDKERKIEKKKSEPFHLSQEVNKAIGRHETRTGEKVSQKPSERIRTYLDRLENVFMPRKLENHPDFNRQERNLELLKNSIFDRCVTKLEDVPDSYLERQLRERGLSGDYAQASEKDKQELKYQNLEPVLRDQQASLEQWIDYFGSTDSNYMPIALKYWVFREITSLQEYDKDNHKFPKREQEKNSTGKKVNITVNKFPDLNQEALGYVLNAIQNKYQGKAPELEYDIAQTERENFQKFLQGENFAKLYAWSIELINPIPEHLLKITDGKWIKYQKGSSHRPLVDSIRRKGTGWCTAGENTAKTQLNAGEFYVYYSLDDESKPTIPRIAIRMEGGNIGEIRGIGYKQNMDPFIDATDVLKNKLDEKDTNENPIFSDKELYLKKDHDMRFLTQIENKTKKSQQLTKEDRTFLYEIDSQIQGFGYQKDPRIAEIREQRNQENDMLDIFECTKEQIAYNINEVNENTKAYIGQWNTEIFQKLKHYSNIKHLYESFPEEKIFMLTLETNPETNTSALAKESLKNQNIYLSDWGENILHKTEFSKEKQKYNLVRFAVHELGFPNGATTEEIYQKANELGLELCPAEVGPHLRLKYHGGEWMLIAMKQILDRDGSLRVFSLCSSRDRLELRADSAEPSERWDSDVELVFVLRKLGSKTL